MKRIKTILNFKKKKYNESWDPVGVSYINEYKFNPFYALNKRTSSALKLLFLFCVSLSFNNSLEFNILTITVHTVLVSVEVSVDN